MSREFEQDLANASPPEYENPRHRELLRAQLLGEFERRRQMTARRRRMTLIYGVLALVGISTIVVAHPVVRGYVLQGLWDGAYVFQRRSTNTVVMDVDGRKVGTASTTVVMITPNDSKSKVDVDQTRRDLEEIDRLRQAGARELVRITETEVAGTSHRSYGFKYTLSDGRTRTMGEGDPNVNIPEAIQSLDIAELYRLRNTREGLLLSPTEEVIDGSVFRFERYRLVLPDGREVVHSIGKPTESYASVSPERRATIKIGRSPASQIDMGQKKADLEEIGELRKAGKRSLARVYDTEVGGKRFRSYSCRYVLADGREKSMGEGAPGFTRVPPEIQSVDVGYLFSLRRNGEGELLSPTEEMIEGEVFVFERYRFILTNGTEVTHSVGKPKVQEREIQAISASASDLARDGFSLLPNLPNPFNPETVIRYETGKAGPVRIVVYNVVGQQIRTLVDQGMAAGKHQARWDGRDEMGRDVASGTYLVRMDAERFSQTRKISLLR